ncbi:MAG: glycoside hydrolase family 3 N-terminal domain-containing protein [Acutalibacter sp.]|jgi:beta-glucosidase
MDTKEIARRAVESSAVLLKNQGLLPLDPGQKVAFFGRAQLETVLSGNGSGAAHSGRKVSVLESCKEAGLVPVAPLEEFYRLQIAQYQADQPAQEDPAWLKEAVNSGLMYELFGKYSPNPPEFPIPEELIRQAAGETSVALWILGRKSGGEECDRHLEDDYYLSAQEKALLDQLCRSFDQVAVVLNVNGLMDLSWVEEHPQIKSLLFLGIPGEEGPEALANLLTGKVSPSGKLSVTLAKDCRDYPAWEDFSWDKDHPDSIRTYQDYGLPVPESSREFARRPVTVYREDLYLGYRYFDSFGKTPLYPFGFGLSYTTFSLTAAGVERTPQGLAVKALVKNTGTCSGRETAQLYLSAQGTRSQRPYQELKAFAKTGELAPGQEETLTLTLPWRELACFREEDSAWVIEAGTYLLRLGNSSASTQVVSSIQVQEEILIQQAGCRLAMAPNVRETVDLLSRETSPVEELPQGCQSFLLTPGDVTPRQAPQVPAVDVSSLSDQELAALCVGFGPGIPWAALMDTVLPDTISDQQGNPLTVNDHPAGFAGYVSPAIPEKGIHSLFYKDGPAGVGGTSWPGEMLLACSFDKDLFYAMGDGIGQECQDRQVDLWLAPALNLHRHPLGGRNFEYYSEDPVLAGACACALLRGLQENHPVLGCAKHFAANEQETYRRGSAKDDGGKAAFDAVDSIVSQRALRELYLKPFQMAVEQGDLHCVMTSFNKINGTFAGGSKDLCTHILREEWGFDGAVVTDWGDMDIVVDGADGVAAGNDVIMPGGPPVIQQILQGLEEGRVTRQELETAVGHLLSMVKRLGRLERDPV